MTNSLIPNVDKLNTKELEALSKLVAEQEHLINVNGYLAFSQTIKAVHASLTDYSFSPTELRNDIQEAIKDSIDSIHRIEFIGLCVAEIVAGFSLPSQCVQKYLAKYGEFQDD